MSASSMTDACTSKDLEDIEDLMLPDGVDARQSKRYVVPRAVRHKTLSESRTSADSIIPGN